MLTTIVLVLFAAVVLTALALWAVVVIRAGRGERLDGELRSYDEPVRLWPGSSDEQRRAA